MLQNARKKASEGMCTDSHKEDRNRLDLVSIPYETSDKGMNEFTDQTRMSTDTKKYYPYGMNLLVSLECRSNNRGKHRIMKTQVGEGEAKPESCGSSFLMVPLKCQQ